MRILLPLYILVLFHAAHLRAVSGQPTIDAFPYIETFESAMPPELPEGWITSMNRDSGGDFVTEEFQGATRLSTRNAALEQFVRTSAFDFTGYRPTVISFLERRSGTFDAELLLLAITTDDTLIVGSTLLTDASAFIQTSFPLPPDLLNQTGVRFEWRIVPGEGTAGTLRIDDVGIFAERQYTHDLRVVGFTVDPPLPTDRDELECRILIRNYGLEPASGFSVLIDIAEDPAHGADLSSEIPPVVNHISSPLLPGDSVSIAMIVSPLEAGVYTLSAHIEYTSNEPTGLPVPTRQVHTTGAVRSFPWTEIFSEEITQSMDALPVDWRPSRTDTLADASLTASIVHSGDRAILMSDATRMQYVVLPPFDVSDGVLTGFNFYERRTGTFDAVVHVEISVDRGRSFESIAAFGHSGETVYIPRTVVIDDEYSAPDILYIRLRAGGEGTGRTGTIRFDSFTVLARHDHDLAVTAVSAEPDTPAPGKEVRLFVEVENVGLSPAAGFTVHLYRSDDTGDYRPAAHLPSQFTLGPGDSEVFIFPIGDLPPGTTEFRAAVEYQSDANPANDNMDFSLFVRFPNHILTINEILYHTRDGQCEYVEIYNPSDMTVDLRGWAIRDRETPGGNINRYFFGDTTMFIPPGGFAVLAGDSSIFNWQDVNGTEAVFVTAGRRNLGLSTAGDLVMLLDPAGTTIDSVAYEPSWHHPDITDIRGRSLERISPTAGSNDPANWSTAADPRGGTPGKPNSIFAESPVSTARIDISPNPFSPNADGFEDHTIIAYNLPQHTAMVRVRIFDALGRHIRTLRNNEPAGPSGEIVWDGRDDNGRTVRLGIYIVLFEAYDDRRSGVTQMKSTVVVADRL
jgi:hypothetical protein